MNGPGPDGGANLGGRQQYRGFGDHAVMSCADQGRTWGQETNQ